MSGCSNSILLKQEQNRCLIRLASFDDTKLLRKWKNENRHCFFYKDIITEQQQFKWFIKYLNRKDDYVYIIEYDREKIGSIAYRLIDNKIDIYNVILADKEYSSMGIMSYALRYICDKAKRNYESDITVKVLIDNSAASFYEKNGFDKIYTNKEYIFMRLNETE